MSSGGTEVESSTGDTDVDGFVGFIMSDIEAGAYEQGATRETVRDLFIRLAYQDAGVGTRLLATAEDALADAGVDAVASGVLAGNKATRRFYRRYSHRPHHVELEKSM